MKSLSIVVAIAVIFVNEARASHSQENWTCYRRGSEYLVAEFKEGSYKASLSGTLERVHLYTLMSNPAPLSGRSTVELKGSEEPFYDSINHHVKFDHPSYDPQGPDRQQVKAKVQITREGYYDCQGDFRESETLECVVEIERN